MQQRQFSLGLPEQLLVVSSADRLVLWPEGLGLRL